MTEPSLPKTEQGPPYRAEIDGLRALAVVAVVMFHAGLPGFPGGFIGVDIFFVISGFLITLILMRDIARGRFSILAFYERRARRILPALFLVVASTAPFAWVIMLPSQRQALAESWAALALFISNLLFGAQLGYFTPDASERPLLHTWSLSVEEQFYVFFPLVLLLCWKLGRRAPAIATGLLCAGSLALAQYGSLTDPSFSFYFTGTRVWELMAGALAALAERHWGQTKSQGLAALGLAMVALPLVLFDESTPSPSVLTAIPVLGTALLLCFARQGTLVARGFAVRPAVAVGLISYSAYLWHQPLFALSRIWLGHEPSTVGMLTLVATTFALAGLSWRYVEMPFRRRPAPLLPRRIWLFTASLAGLALMLGLGVGGWAIKGGEARWLANNPQLAATYEMLVKTRLARSWGRTFPPCHFNLDHIDAAGEARIDNCAAELGPAFVVLGDSHAIDVYTALAGLAADRQFILGTTASGCRLKATLPACPLHDLAAFVARKPASVSHILFVQSGAALMVAPNGEPGSRQLFARLAWDAHVPDFQPDMAEIDRTAAFLTDLAGKVPVTWLAPRIEPHVPMAHVLRQGCSGLNTMRTGQREAFERLDTAIAARLAGGPVTYLPLSAMPFDMTHDFLNCTEDYWSDGDHWSPQGEAHFGARLLPLLGLPPRQAGSDG